MQPNIPEMFARRDDAFSNLTSGGFKMGSIFQPQADKLFFKVNSTMPTLSGDFSIFSNPADQSLDSKFKEQKQKTGSVFDWSAPELTNLINRPPVSSGETITVSKAQYEALKKIIVKQALVLKQCKQIQQVRTRLKQPFYPLASQYHQLSQLYRQVFNPDLKECPECKKQKLSPTQFEKVFEELNLRSQFDDYHKLLLQNSNQGSHLVSLFSIGSKQRFQSPRPEVNFVTIMDPIVEALPFSSEERAAWKIIYEKCKLGQFVNVQTLSKEISEGMVQKLIDSSNNLTKTIVKSISSTYQNMSELLGDKKRGLPQLPLIKELDGSKTSVFNQLSVFVRNAQLSNNPTELLEAIEVLTRSIAVEARKRTVPYTVPWKVMIE